MKFNLLCISYHLLVVTNLANAKKETLENLVIADITPAEPITTRGRGNKNQFQLQDTTSKIFTDASGLSCLTSTICTSSIESIENSLLQNENVLVEKDRILNSQASISSTTEVTSWGVAQVLEDMAFWDAADPPSDEIKVCIVGSGYDLTHPDLPSEPDVIGSNSSWTDEVWSVDVYGPGTHSAGTIAAIGSNDKGVQGIVPNNKGGKFKLVVGKASWGEDGTGKLSSEIEAVTSCQNQGAKVIVNTLGSEVYSQIEADFYQTIYDAGILVFAPAGNGGDETFTYPASLPTVISVAQSDINKQWDDSHKNDQIELTAPGTKILSTLPNGEYGTMTGTSMSTAHAGAVAGLIWMYFPTCTSSQIRAVLAKTAFDLGESGCEEKFGHGLIQAKAAYDLLDEGSCGGNIGSATAVGGCFQLKSPVLSESCSSNLDCNDDDPCTVDTCQDSVCSYDYDCARCGLSSLVTVDITTDESPEETTWEILDYSTYERVMAKGTSSYGNNDRKYSKSQCLGEGGYLFVIYDTFGDGMCCEYGRGKYDVKVGGVRKVLGSEFKSTKSHFFSVTNTPTTFSPTRTYPPVKSSTESSSANPTSSPTQTAAPTSLSCASNVDCDDGDDCTDDTCGVDSMCNFAVNCASCGLTSVITVNILTDFSPEETSWEIKEFKTNEVIAKSSEYHHMAHSYSTQKCVDKGTYVFSIYDSADDGICCANHAGSYTVSVDGTTKATGGQFKSAEMHLISIDDIIATSNPRNPIPTWAPSETYIPTGTPTDSKLPTGIPSDVPTFMPSRIPSTAPSNSPSDNPSAWCAKLMDESQGCNSALVDKPPICCGNLVCYGDKCVPDCGAEGETSGNCDDTLGSDYKKPSCCSGLVCGADKKCMPLPKLECAKEFKTSKQCKSNAADNVLDECCPGLKCGDGGVCVQHCAAQGEDAISCDNSFPNDSPRRCCAGLECSSQSGKCDWPKTCAKPGFPSKCCNKKNAKFDSCCGKLVCDENKNCAEPPICARDDYSKECGGRYAYFEKCCDGYVCQGKKCVKTKDEKVCGVTGNNALSCGMCWSDLSNRSFDSLRKICCEGYVCTKDHTPVTSSNCIKQYAPKFKTSIKCGDVYSKFLECEKNHECNPFEGLKTQCIAKSKEDAPEKKKAMECGNEFAKYNHCAEGLGCEYASGKNFKKCIKLSKIKAREFVEKTVFCALENQNAKQCKDAPYANADVCCEGLKCEPGSPSKKSKKCVSPASM